MNDGADCELDLNTARFAAQTIRSDLAKAGIVSNSSKSIWVPTRVIEWLGLIWNLREGFLAISDVGQVSKASRFTAFVKKPVAPRHSAISRFGCGKDLSLTPGVGNVCLLMCT